MLGQGDINVILNLVTDKADAAWDRFSKDLNDGQQRISSQIKATTLAASGGIISGLALAAKVSGEFEASLNKLKAATGVAGEEFTQLRNQAKELGSTTQFSASQAAEGMTVLGQAGLDASQIYEAMPDLLNLSAAGGLALNDAAGILTTTMAGFKLEATDASRITDVLATAATSGKLEVGDFATSMKYAASISSSANLSLEESVAILTKLQSAGADASTAGTQLRGALQVLLNPTANAQEILDKYNVTVDDGAGSVRNLITVMSELKAAGITTSDVFGLFGAEAGTGINSLINLGDNELPDLVKSLLDVDGAAGKMADTMNQGLEGQIKSLQSAWEGLLIAIGDTGVLDVFTGIIAGATNVIATIAKLPPPLLKAITVLAAVVAIVPPVVFGLSALVGAFATVKGAVLAVWGLPLVAGLVGWVKGVMVPAIGTVVATIGAVPIAYVALVASTAYLTYQIQQNWDEIVAITSALINNLRGKFSEFTSWLSTLDWKEIGANLIRSFVDGLKSMIPLVKDTMGFITSTIDGYLPHSPAKVGALSKLGEVGTGLVSTILQGIVKDAPKIGQMLADLSGVNNLGSGGGSLSSTAAFQTGSPNRSGQASAQAPEINITINGNVTDEVLQELRRNLRDFQTLVIDANRQYGDSFL